jgi:MFS family permease
METEDSVSSIPDGAESTAEVTHVAVAGGSQGGSGSSGPEAAAALVPALLFLGMVVAMTSSLGAPLVPTIAGAMNVSVDTAQWSLTAALLAGAVSTPTLGRIGDGPHRRTAMMVVLGGAICGSALAAATSHFSLLLVGRTLQGAAIGLMPMAIGVARSELRGPRARSAIALLSVTTAAGVGLGYPATGAIADQFGYRWAFWLGAVIAAAALVGVRAVVPRDHQVPWVGLDVTGAVLMAAGLLPLLLAISEGSIWGWGTPRVLGLLAVAVALLATWIWWELTTDAPLVDLRLMQHPLVITANLAGLIAGIAMYILLSLTIRFVETPQSAGYGFGASVLVAGLVILPLSVAAVVSSRWAMRFGQRFGLRPVIPLGSLLFALSLVWLLLEHDHLWNVMVTTTIAGIGLGFTFAAMPSMILRAVPMSEAGSATSMNQLLRSVGFCIGSAVAAAVLSAYTARGATYPAWAGFQVGLLIAVGFWILTACVSFLVPQRRDTVSGPPPVTEGATRDALATEPAQPGGRHA